MRVRIGNRSYNAFHGAAILLAAGSATVDADHGQWWMFWGAVAAGVVGEAIEYAADRRQEAANFRRGTVVRAALRRPA